MVKNYGTLYISMPQGKAAKNIFFLQEKALKHVAKTGHLTIHAHAAMLCVVLSHSRGEKSGEGLVPILRHGREMVDSIL